MENEIQAFCQNNGVPYEIRNDHLRVMDVTQLPMPMREACDERGFVITADAEEPEAAEEESNETDTHSSEKVSGSKRRSKARN